MTDRRPNVVVLAGPNGAGKTTSATGLLDNTFRVEEFVNADIIAKGLSGFRSGNAAMEAGRITLRRLKQLGDDREDFAFETTLASKTFAPFLRRLIADGYSFHLVFFWLSSAELAISRVAHRVAAGGHDIPPGDIRRRYTAGLQNFFKIYRPLTATWAMYDNSLGETALVADGCGVETSRVFLPKVWESIQHHDRSETDSA